MTYIERMRPCDIKSLLMKYTFIKQQYSFQLHASHIMLPFLISLHLGNLLLLFLLISQILSELLDLLRQFVSLVDERSEFPFQTTVSRLRFTPLQVAPLFGELRRARRIEKHFNLYSSFLHY